MPLPSTRIWPNLASFATMILVPVAAGVGLDPALGEAVPPQAASKASATRLQVNVCNDFT